MRILFLSEAVSLAHIGRPLTLAKEAFQNGWEVHFACAKGALEKINVKVEPLISHELYTIDGDLFYQRVNQGRFFYEYKELKKYVEAEINLINLINPDLIVSDFRLTSAISAKLTNKPLLNLSNAYWSPHYSCPFPAPNFGIFKFLSEKASNIIFNMMRPFVFKSFGKELNQLRKYYGLEKKSDFRELYTDGTYTAYMDMPDFVTLKNMPSNHFYLGPILWSPNTMKEKIQLKGKGNVYISMGSSGNLSILPEIIKPILQKGYQLIISGVNSYEANEIYQKIPLLKYRSVIRPLIDADKVLAHCSLTICHGGSGTVYQSLSHGVPVMCFPKNPDQALVSMIIENKNLGRTLSSKNATEANINAVLNECLSNEILKKNATNYALKMEQLNTLTRWNQFLNQFKTVRKFVKETA